MRSPYTTTRESSRTTTETQSRQDEEKRERGESGKGEESRKPPTCLPQTDGWCCHLLGQEAISRVAGFGRTLVSSVSSGPESWAPGCSWKDDR